ncbi:MAG: hypothetical protein ACYDDA_04955 [Acidiferrobacteraceae bacterium]
MQAAIHVRDHVRDYKRGTIAQTLTYNGQTVALWVSSHSWTWRNGVLIQGICISGVAVLQQAGTSGVGATEADNLDTPDPTAAVYAGPPDHEATNWPLVAVSGVALVATVTAFWLALKLAGRPRLP